MRHDRFTEYRLTRSLYRTAIFWAWLFLALNISVGIAALAWA